MGTVHGTRRKGKRKKRLSEVRVVSGAEYGEMELSGKVELIRQLIPLRQRYQVPSVCRVRPCHGHL